MDASKPDLIVEVSFACPRPEGDYKYPESPTDRRDVGAVEILPAIARSASRPGRHDDPPIAHRARPRNRSVTSGLCTGVAARPSIRHRCFPASGMRVCSRCTTHPRQGRNDVTRVGGLAEQTPKYPLRVRCWRSFRRVVPPHESAQNRSNMSSSAQSSSTDASRPSARKEVHRPLSRWWRRDLLSVPKYDFNW